MFDYLIVGAGLTGAVLARELTDAGRRVLVIDKRQHLGGQCYTQVRDGQIMNLYGAHIFHTNDAGLWAWIGRFADWEPYTHRVKAVAGGRLYSFPPNRTTYLQLGTDDEAALRAAFFVGYTEKMWGRPYADVPASVTRRIPMRQTADDRYFTDTYQGLPAGGYTPLFERLLAGIDVRLSTDYLADRWSLDRLARRVVYTGPLDALFDHDAGRLEWRGMRFEHAYHIGQRYQPAATVNYCDAAVPWLREEEWRWFWPPAGRPGGTWVTRSYPDAAEQFYPVPDERNNALAADYKARAETAGYVIAGRLGTYRYLDMHQAIAAARVTAAKELANVPDYA